MPSKRSILINFLTQLTGKGFSVVIGLALTVILARTLGDTVYGEYTTAITFLQLFGVVVDFGLTLTMAAMLSAKGANESSIAGNIFGLRMTSAVILFALAPLLALPFPWTGTVRLGIAVGAIAYACMAGATMLVGVFQKHGSIWRASLAEILSRVLLLGLFALFAWLHLGLVAMIAAMIAANLVWLVLMLVFARPFVHIRPRFEWKVWKKALGQSWPIALSILFNLLYLKGDVLFLASFRDSTEVGWYGLAYRLIDMVTTIPTMFMGLMLPTLVSDWSGGKKMEFLEHLRVTYGLFWMLACPIVAGVQLVALPIIILIGGEEFAPAAEVLKVLIWCVPGVFLGALYGHAVIALKKQRIMIWGFAITAILTVVGYLLLIPAFGMYGAAGMTIASELLISVFGAYLVYRTCASFPSIILPLKTIGCAFAMWMILARFPHTSPFIIIPAGCVLYLAFLVGIRALRLQDLRFLRPERSSTPNPPVTPYM